MAGEDHTVAAASVSEKDVLINQATVFDNINYMGRAVIGASVSNVEANAIIAELDEYHTESKVTLAIPHSPEGFVRILDEKREELHSDPVKAILYCTKSAKLPHCFAFTSGKKGGSMYYCHAFKCKDKEICMRVLNCMATTFNRGLKKNSISDTLHYEFDLSLEILEEDGSGTPVPVPQDKDTFKMRERKNHHIVVTVTQSNSSALILERCCGVFLAPGDSTDPDNYMLLDMPLEMEMGSSSTGPLYVIKGIWDPVSQPCHWLTGEGTRSVTLAVDVVASGVLDPIRFERKTQFKIYPETERFFLNSRYLSQQSYTVKLKLNSEDKHRRFSLDSVTEKPMSSSPSRLKSLFAGFGVGDDYSDDISESEDEEPLISGSDDGIEEASEETLKTWNTLLDSWTDYCTRPPELVKLARKGIPNSLRATVWMRLGGLTEELIEDKYRHLYDESRLKECPHEQVIIWDLNRTFPGNEYFREGKDGQEKLYRVCKSYAGADQEVGYCQGLSFIVAVLLLHLEEEKAFALFSVVMKEYQFRDMFKKGFQMLQLKFYILERIIEDQMPDLWEHFQKHELNTHMYASQWFLTLFSAKFPLGLVYRIVDMFLTEGPDTLYKVAVSLLKLSRNDLISQDFEEMLKYFRVALPKRFMNKKQGQKLLSTAASVKIKPGKVAVWEAQFHQIQDEKRSLQDPVRRAEHELKLSRENNHRLEQENDMLVLHLTQNQVNMRHQLDELEKRNLELKRDLAKMTSSYEEMVDSNSVLSSEIERTKNLYHSSLIEGDDERARHKLTIKEYHNMCRALEERHEKEKQELNQEVIEIKAQVGGKAIDIPSEQRLRELEMELAKTKLCLVEANCKAQEYEHKCTTLLEKLKHYETGVLNHLKAKLNR
ncbi:hypothetical protein ACHWQZ_G016932 [Mnemiopsis leidyi]